MRRLFTAIFFVIVSFASAQTLDPNFQVYITSKVEAKGAILFSDGKYLVYGEFAQANGANMMGAVKFNADGTVDNTFNIGTGPNASVNAAVLQADGKIILSGGFTSFNGVSRAGLIRLNSDGSVDNTFTPNLTLNTGSLAMRYVLTLQSNGKILYVGPASTVDGVSTSPGNVLRFNTDGSRDTSFSPVSGLYTIFDAAVQSDGKIIVVGNFTTGIARINSNGTIDGTFSVGTGFNSWVFDVEISTSDRIIAGGNFSQFNGVSYPNIVALTTSGAVDGTFLANGKLDGTVSGLKLGADGKLLVAGYFGKYNTTTVKTPIRLGTDGSLDGTLTIGTGPNYYVDLVTCNASGDILVLGDPTVFTTFNGTGRIGLAILNSTGSLKSMSQTLDLQGSDIVDRILRQGTDKILIAHQGEKINGTPSTGFERLNLDGTLDVAFSGSSKPNKYPSTIALDQTGRILIGGQFTSYNGTATPYIARLSSSGVLDNTFTINNGTGFNGIVTAIKEQPDGKILVGGIFTSFNGVLRKSLARLNSDGTLDATFNTVNGFTTSSGSPSMTDFEIQSDGKILVAGSFDSFNSHSVKNIIRLNSDGSYDATFLIGTGASSTVKNVRILDNGQIMIAGDFYTVNGTVNPYLSLLNSDGTLVNPNNWWQSNVYKIEKEPNGKILVVDANSNNKGLSRLNADGSVDNTFTPVYVLMSPSDLAFFGTCVIRAGYGADRTKFSILKYTLPTNAAPTNLAVQSFTKSKISLSWTDNSDDEAGFEIYRSTSNNTSYTLIQTTGANTTSYTDAGLTGGATYYYKIRAVNLANTSTYSNEVSQLTPPVDWSGPIATSLPAREYGVAVVINGKAYVGLGRNSSALKDWWEYNPSGNVWTQKMDFPGSARIQAVAFVINGKAYVGSGDEPFSSSSVSRKADFYEYNPATNSWTAKADIPHPIGGTGITSAVAFAIGNYGYVGLGFGNSGSNNYTTALYRFDPVANSWVARANFPAAGRLGAIGFAANGLGFAGLGAVGPGTPNLTDMYQYNPAADTWTVKQSYNGNGRADAAVATINNDAFIFGGTENTTGFFGADVRVNSTTSYSTTNNAWTDQPSIPGPVRAGAMAFTIGKVAYIFGGFNDSGGVTYLADLYSYSPPSSFLPVAPTSAATSLVSETEVQCTWIDNSTDETGFVIEYAIGNSSTYTTAGAVAANVTTYNITGLTADTQYKFRATAYNGYGYSLPSNISNIITTLPPSSPSNLLAQAASTTSITLTWTDNSSTETGFEIYRSAVDNTGYSLIKSMSANSSTYTDIGLTSGTSYFYKLRAVNAGGGSAYSNEANPPFSPTSLSVQQATSSQVVLSWTDNSTNETGFEIYRSSGSNTSYALVQTTAANATTFTDDGLISSTAYYYKIRAINTSGTSLYSNEVTPPAEPSNFLVQSFTSSQIALKWTDNSTNETGFEIYRSSPSNTSYTLVKTTTSNTTTYTDTGLGSSTTYYYKVRAINLGGMSVYSSEINQATLPTPPTAPSGLSAQSPTSAQVVLNWTDNSSNETGFEIYRSSPSNTGYVLIQTTGADITTFTDTGLISTTTYYYRIRAINSGGASAYSSEVTPPFAPSNLSVQSFTATQVVLNWVDNSTTETGFEIYRSPSSNSQYVLVQTVAANTTLFTDVGLSPATTYYYKIRAVNTGGSSADSNEINKTTLPNPPTVPSNLSVQSYTASQIVLTWADNSSNETGFEIYRSSPNNSNYTLVQTTGSNATTFTDLGLSSATTYYYKIRAINTGGSSSYTAEINQVTLPNPPESPLSLSANWVSASKLTLSWTDNSSNETGFEIYRSVSDNTAYALVQTTTANVTTYTDNNVAAGTTYYYKARAINQGGNSAYSAEISTLITGIEPTSHDFVIYPNPTYGDLVVENSTAHDLRFVIYSSIGELILEDEVSANSKRVVNSRSWNTGMYIISLPTRNSSYKIIKN